MTFHLVRYIFSRCSGLGLFELSQGIRWKQAKFPHPHGLLGTRSARVIEQIADVVKMYLPHGLPGLILQLPSVFDAICGSVSIRDDH